MLIRANSAVRTLFKYMRAADAARMLADGEVRLGTLYSYRDEEKLGSEIGDAQEGTLTLKKSGLTILDSADRESIPAFLRGRISAEDGARFQIVARDGVMRRFSDPDCWIYCASQCFDYHQMTAMGYDTCVEIVAIEPFFFGISRAIGERISEFVGAAACVYADREIEASAYGGIPPAFLKHPRFQRQEEVRAVWIPLAQKVEPIIVRARQILPYCRQHRG